MGDLHHLWGDGRLPCARWHLLLCAAAPSSERVFWQALALHRRRPARHAGEGERPVRTQQRACATGHHHRRGKAQLGASAATSARSSRLIVHLAHTWMSMSNEEAACTVSTEDSVHYQGAQRGPWWLCAQLPGFRGPPFVQCRV